MGIEKKEEDSKYYTPSIEEFRIGFECELLDKDNFKNGQIVPCWIKKIFNTNYNYYEGMIERNSIRVKYLDSSDIESLGFIESRYSGTNHAYFHNKNNDVRIEYLRHSHILSVCTMDPSINNVPETYSTSFYGTIKNISELKVLLTQLGIQ
mgnify:CR=1 FL=1